METFKHTGVYDKYGVELYPGDIVGMQHGTRDVIEEFGSHLVGSFSYRPLGATNPTSSYPLYDLVKHDGIEIVGNKDIGNVEIRAIRYSDMPNVKSMDSESGFNVFGALACYDELEFGDYAYGAFLNGKLIGYCTVGGAEEYDKYKDYRINDLCLSDVFVKEEYRHKHIGSIMVAKAIALEFKGVRRNVFATILTDDDLQFYKDLGFVVIAKNEGVVCRRVKFDMMTAEEYNTCFLPMIDKAKAFVSRLDSCVCHMELDDDSKQKVRKALSYYGWSPSVEDVLIKALDSYDKHEGIEKLP